MWIGMVRLICNSAMIMSTDWQNVLTLTHNWCLILSIFGYFLTLIYIHEIPEILQLYKISFHLLQYGGGGLPL